MAFTGSNWGRRVKLTGLSPASTLSGYVAVITLDNIPAEAIDAGANSALSGGGDLRFSTDDAGVNQLECDVVGFVPSAIAGNRECKIFVRFPTYSSAAREVWMFYRKAGESQPAAGAAFGQYATWTGYPLAVVMENTTPVNRVDGAALTSSGVVASTGPLGNALDFSSAYINCGADKLGSGDFSSTVLVNPDTSGSYRGILGNWTTSGSGRGYLGQYDGNIRCYEYDGGQGNKGTLATGAWAHLSYARSGDDYWVRKDGAASGSGTDTGTQSTSLDTIIGALTGGTNYYFDGKIAVAMVCDTYHDSDYTDTESNNLKSPATFWTTGTPEDAGGGGGGGGAEGGALINHLRSMGAF